MKNDDFSLNYIFKFFTKLFLNVKYNVQDDSFEEQFIYLTIHNSLKIVVVSCQKIYISTIQVQNLDSKF